MQTRNKKSKGVKCNWAQRTEFIGRPQQQTSSCIWEMRVFNETIFLSNYYIYVPKVFFSAMNFKRLEFGLTLFCFVNNLFRKGFWKFWKQSHSIRSTCGYQIAMFSAMICWILLSDLGIFVLTFDMCSWHTHDCKLLHNIESIFFFLKIKEKNTLNHQCPEARTTSWCEVSCNFIEIDLFLLIA